MFVCESFQQQIAELTDELSMMKNEKVLLVEKLRDKEKVLNDTNVALSNLQKVLRDIGTDHNVQIAQYEEDIAVLRKEIEVIFVFLR